MTQPELYAKYVTTHKKYIGELYDKYLLSLDWAQNRKHTVLDIGCGAGNILFDVLELRLPDNCTKIVGSDKSEGMVNYCKNASTSPRMEFVQIDIEADKGLLDNFKNSFDHLFSTYCLQYVANLRTSLQNCFSMLKPGGDLLFIFTTNNVIYETYRELSKIDKWFSYVKDFKNYEGIFDNKNAEDVRKYFEECGFTVKSCVIENKKLVYTNMHTIGRFVLDPYLPKMPEEEKENYKKDLRLALENYKHFEFIPDDKGNKIPHLLFRTVTIIAQKPF